MKDFTWSNKMGNRKRDAWLLFIIGDKVVPFNGRKIEGVAVVIGTDKEKNGIWSHTTFRIQLADGVRYIHGHDGWETNTFGEGLGAAIRSSEPPDTWPIMAKALGVSVPSAMEFLRAWRPKAAEKLDRVERALIDLEEASNKAREADLEMVTVSFGNPTNRAASEGYWQAPKNIPGYKAEIRLKDPNQGWYEGNIEIVGIAGTIISVKHTSGMHGGYYAVSVAVMPGTETKIPPFKSGNEEYKQNNSGGGNTILGEALKKAGF